MHDDQQVVRLYEMDKSLSTGQFPVRWVDGLGFGLGYPLFNFYPPLTYYLGEIFHLGLNTGFIDSIKLVWFVAFIGSGITMYFLSREFFGRSGGLVSSMFYIYAPYHAIDSYVRGAQAELFSFVWLPLILLFSYKAILENSYKWSIWTGVTLGLLMVTHNLIFLPFFGLFTLWFGSMILIYGEKKRGIQYVLHYALQTLLAFGLTAFFWLPALAEKKFTLVDQLLIKNLASYKIHFVCPEQLWNSLWGFGGSVAGCIDGMSFKIGKLHILAALAALVIALIRRSKILVVSFILFAFSVFMTTQYSNIIWDKIPQLWYLQFPWRFLEFAALFSSLSAGAMFVVFGKDGFTLIGYQFSRIRWIMAGVLICVVIVLNAKLFQPREYLKVTDADLTSNEEIKWRVSGTSFEYLPGWVPTKINPNGTVGINITKEQALSKESPIQNVRERSNMFNTPMQKIGNIISLASIGSLVFLGIYAGRRNKK